MVWSSYICNTSITFSSLVADSSLDLFCFYFKKSHSLILLFQAENEKILRDLLKIAVDQHVEFRKIKYFPLDPNYITESLQEESAYKESIQKMKQNLIVLTKRLNNSVPFFSFRSQVYNHPYYPA